MSSIDSLQSWPRNDTTRFPWHRIARLTTGGCALCCTLMLPRRQAKLLRAPVVPLCSLLYYIAVTENETYDSPAPTAKAKY